MSWIVLGTTEIRVVKKRLLIFLFLKKKISKFQHSLTTQTEMVHRKVGYNQRSSLVWILLDRDLEHRIEFLNLVWCKDSKYNLDFEDKDLECTTWSMVADSLEQQRNLVRIALVGLLVDLDRPECRPEMYHSNSSGNQLHRNIHQNGIKVSLCDLM